jgi:hypothetical protein
LQRFIAVYLKMLLKQSWSGNVIVVAFGKCCNINGHCVALLDAMCGADTTVRVVPRLPQHYFRQKDLTTAGFLPHAVKGSQPKSEVLR